MNKKASKKLIYSITIASGTAISLATPVIMLLFIGKFLDHAFHTQPMLLLTGIILGFIIGVYNTFVLLKILRVL